MKSKHFLVHALICYTPTVQHVSDILRDKLQNIGAELVEAKSRVSSLEQAQAGDRDALRVSSNALSDASVLSPFMLSQDILINAFPKPNKSTYLRLSSKNSRKT